MGRPEVLAPAGDFEKLRFAVAYGADAVYLAGKAYGMRTASGNFTPEEMQEAVAEKIHTEFAMKSDEEEAEAEVPAETAEPAKEVTE